MPKFFNNDIAELTHQLTLSPRRLRVEQIHGIETLLGLIEPEKAYPFDFVCYHITKYQKRAAATGSFIPGKALTCDLVTMAEVLSRKANLTVAELGESFETHQQLSDRLRVSTKTVRRWRNRGLMGLRVVFEDGVNRLAFLGASVERFVARNRALVNKGAAFRQLTAGERNGIVERARELLAQRRLRLHAVSKLIAEETGRAVETVRYTLRRYDESSEAAPLFRAQRDGQACSRGAAMWRCRQAGESIAQIARTYECSQSEVEQELRIHQVLVWQEAPLEYVANDLFHDKKAEALILQGPEPRGAEASSPRIPKDLPAYLRSLYATPLLTPAQEQDLFRRYNFLKFRTALAVKALKPEKASQQQVDAIQEDMRTIDAIRRRITQANLRLVVSIAKRHVGRSERFYEVVSDGNLSLMRAIEKFDYARGNKFSTYATWAIMKNYARSVPEEHYFCKRYVTGQDEVLEAAPDQRVEAVAESDRQTLRELLRAGMNSLSEREREVLSNHYGLESKEGGLTLEQIGRRFGVTKERIRQIEQAAMARLRDVLSPSLAEAVTG
jgi:RNA polymerase sigma factor (sigma-70 family)